MKKVIVKLEKPEVEEIENCFERSNSLSALALAFESDEVFSKNADMYEKLVDDLTVTNKKIRNWWDCIIKKYELQEYEPSQLYVDFYDEQIMLAD